MSCCCSPSYTDRNDIRRLSFTFIPKVLEGTRQVKTGIKLMEKHYPGMLLPIMREKRHFSSTPKSEKGCALGTQ